jgi:hypothetical protein
MRIIFRPFEGPWPRPLSVARKASPFKSNWASTFKLLKHELEKLNTTDAIIQTQHRESDISPTTGWPRMEASPAHPGVIVAADTKHGALKWPCDDCRFWADNVRAIALTLERLRLADLYGVTRRGEQYLGWKMLPGPITAGGGGAVKPMTMEAAARLIAKEGNSHAEWGAVMRNRDVFDRTYRLAAKKNHPDAAGSDVVWKQLQEASQLIGSLHNKK